ncbi:MAG: response regulator transcription factor [Rhodobacteraceae bacterium]|nr:response regulator transcription factor [Paracoccaceae bacterium]
MDRIRVVVADDHPLYREGVSRSLSEDPDIEVLGEAADADAAVALVEKLQPDIALLDISMPAGGGISALKRICQAGTKVKPVMLTVSENDDDVMQALKSGAAGYILKGVGSRDLIAIVKDIAQGRSYVAPSLAARILNAMRAGGKPQAPRSAVDDLTKREEDILRLVAAGRSNKEVGLELDLQEKTVKHYMTSILQKLQVRNRVEAAIMAREHWKDD